MTDIHIGEILDVLDAYDMWKDTMVIFTTDHGFHLGEHGYMAKNYMAPYNEVFHIPLIICKPGCGAARSQALTQNIDVMPTMLEYFGADQRLHYPLHGKKPDACPGQGRPTDQKRGHLWIFWKTGWLYGRDLRVHQGGKR